MSDLRDLDRRMCQLAAGASRSQQQQVTRAAKQLDIFPRTLGLYRPAATDLAARRRTGPHPAH